MSVPQATADMLDMLVTWQEQGRIGSLDLAFARFIHDHAPEASGQVLLGAALASRQLAHGHVCLDLAGFCRDPEGYVPLPAGENGEPLGLTGLEPDAWARALGQAEGVVLKASATLDEVPFDGQPLVLVGAGATARLHLARYWRHERRVAREVLARVAQERPTPKNLAAALVALFPLDAANGGTDWQKLACALAARRGLTLITGGPGTGKTTTVIRLLALLQFEAVASGRPLVIRLAAPTGKAAARLTASISSQIADLPVAEAVKAAIPAQVGTLHRLLGSRPDSRAFRHHDGNKLDVDVLVVDEASMIDLEMMAAVLAALPDTARLILLGDKDQLASVEAGAVLGELCRDADAGHYTIETLDWLAAHIGARPAGLEPGDTRRHALSQQTAMLRRSRRFDAASGIGRFALAVNRGDGPACRAQLAEAGEEGELASITVGHLDRLVLQGRGAPVGDAAGESSRAGYGHYLGFLRQDRPEGGDDKDWNAWALSVISAFGRFQLLAAVREGHWGVAGLNRRIVRLLQGAGLVSVGEGVRGGRDGERYGGWYEGRPVLVTRNDYGLGVMNGDVGLCLRVPVGRGMEYRVAFTHPEEPARVRFLHPSRLTAVETAFAMTVHKAQGSEFTHAALVLPEVMNPVLTRELVYTAVTRARKNFTLVEHPGRVLEEAVARRVERDSGLKGLLWPE